MDTQNVLLTKMCFISPYVLHFLASSLKTQHSVVLSVIQSSCRRRHFWKNLLETIEFGILKAEKLYVESCLTLTAVNMAGEPLPYSHKLEQKFGAFEEKTQVWALVH